MPDGMQPLPSSYRDPSGFVFEEHAVIYRTVNNSYKDNFELLNSSGLYDSLVKKGILIGHKIVAEKFNVNENVHSVLQPDKVPFITYPYEWTFSMLKDAALLTLQIAKTALRHGMMLKDATPFNVQWKDGRLIFIDTLSFEKFENKPWVAYRQFCECFLGPLLVMHYSKKQLPELSLAWPDGIPIDTIRALLPGRSRFSLHTYLHVHLNARYSKKKDVGRKETALDSKKLNNLLSSLEILIQKLKTPPADSAWSGYYDEASQRKDYLEAKKSIIAKWVDAVPSVRTAIDLGANEGEFARLIAERNIQTIAADFDAYCIDRLYNRIKQEKIARVLPMIVDISHPSPSVGVNNQERSSFIERTKVDLVMALALIHHLSIGKNVPFQMIFEMLSNLGEYLIIEFVPKEDEKVRIMLKDKKDIYANYDRAHFEKALKYKFTIEKSEEISNSGRTLFLAKKR